MELTEPTKASSLWVVARIDIDDTLGGARVKQLIRSIEQALTAESRYIARVDLVPVASNVGV